ncbi:MAG: sulfatase [Chloroflexi bacterium]|nr:sulfatase [Chloroflexota bacterium]
MNEQRERPNIVFLFADDWGRYASAYRRHESEDTVNQLIDTPNFDRVAAEGAIFTNAHVPAPSCTPCRSSILSGTYFWETGLGAILDGAYWDESIPTYPMILEESGYQIGYTYKVWSPGKAENAPYGGQRTRYEPCGNRWREFSQEVSKKVPELGVDGAKELLFDETRGNFVAFLKNVPENKPFCYWWGPVNTHRSWERGSGKSLWGLEPDNLKGRMPEFLPDVPEIREDFNDYLGEVQAVDAGIGIILEELERAGELENTLVIVSGDHGIPGFPRAKCNLYDIGTQVSLAARWPGKIEPGKVVDDLVNLMSLAPTFLEAAGEQPPDNMVDSILPLLTSESEVRCDDEHEYVIFGRERHVAYARSGGLPYPSRAIRTRDFLYIRNFAPDRWPIGDPNGMEDPALVDAEEITRILSSASNRAVRSPFPDIDDGPTKHWMLVNRGVDGVRAKFDLAFGKRPSEELYDLRVDPYYMRNIAGDPSYSETRNTLSAKLLEILENHNDPRLTDVDCRFEESPFAGPVAAEWYEIPHNDVINKTIPIPY